MNNQNPSTLGVTYTVEEEFLLTPEQHRMPVLPALVRSAGFAENTPPSTLLLAQVVFTAARYGGNWKVQAMVNNEPTGSIWCSAGTERNDVLKVVNTWVRESDHVTFVPGSVHEIPTSEDEAPYFVYGVALIRGDRI